VTAAFMLPFFAPATTCTRPDAATTPITGAGTTGSARHGYGQSGPTHARCLVTALVPFSCGRARARICARCAVKPFRGYDS
jgi:hypothetical protein